MTTTRTAANIPSEFCFASYDDEGDSYDIDLRDQSTDDLLSLREGAGTAGDSLAVLTINKLLRGRGEMEDQRLYSSDEGEDLGPATEDQIDASYNAGAEGGILIDDAGRVVSEGTWDAQQPGVRRVYAQ